MAEAQIAVDHKSVVVIAHEITIYALFQTGVILCHIDGKVVAVFVSFLRFHVVNRELSCE